MSPRPISSNQATTTPARANPAAAGRTRGGTASPRAPQWQSHPGQVAAGSKPRKKQLAAIIGVPLALLILMLTFTFWPDPAPATCITGVDAKGSTIKMAAQYQQMWPALARQCALASGGRITVVSVTSDTATTAVPMHTLDLSDPADVPNLSGNADNAKDQQQTALDKWVPQVNAAVFGDIEQAPGGTDLLSLGRVVAPLFTNATGAKSLTILTDGMNNRAPYQFKDTSLDLSPAGIAQLIQTLQATGQIPALPGVDVAMYGVDRGSQSSSLDPARLHQIQQFWEAYFAAAGAKLTTYQAAP